MQFLAVLPLLDPLRGDARFAGMLQRLGLDECGKHSNRG